METRNEVLMENGVKMNVSGIVYIETVMESYPWIKGIWLLPSKKREGTSFISLHTYSGIVLTASSLDSPVSVRYEEDVNRMYLESHEGKGEVTEEDILDNIRNIGILDTMGGAISYLNMLHNTNYVFIPERVNPVLDAYGEYIGEDAKYLI